MQITASSLYSDIARSGPALFFPDPVTPVTFNFDQGVPEEQSFPLDDLLQLHREVLDRDRGLAMEYITMGFDQPTHQIRYLSTYQELIYGNRELRAEIASWLGALNSRPDLNADSVILTLGSVHAIALGINAFVDAGEGVLVEAQSFPYALRYLEMRHADVRPVAMDADGMNTDDLERNLQQMRAEGVRPKMIYIVATFSCPTGLTTSLERRRRILELADEYDLVVLEDAVYSDLRYSGEPVPNLLSLDTTGRVIQSHSFSKIIAPGIRIGWMTGTHDMIAGLAAVKQDLSVSQLTARVMTEYLRRGLLPAHLDKINAVYRRKRDVAAAAVTEHCYPYATFTLPDGGFYLWLELSPDVDWAKTAATAAERGILARPGERFTNDTSPNANRFLRLAFSHVNDDEITRGISELGNAIKDSITQHA
jgi:2-aminoadipate transaminase